MSIQIHKTTVRLIDASKHRLISDVIWVSLLIIYILETICNATLTSLEYCVIACNTQWKLNLQKMYRLKFKQ